MVAGSSTEGSWTSVLTPCSRREFHLTVAGFSTSAKNLAKASNININLWMGIGMLVVRVDGYGPCPVLVVRTPAK
jgi:hypothetical protein